MILEAFAKLTSPAEEEIQALIEKQGGVEKVKRDDRVLQQLLKDLNHPDKRAEDPTNTAAAPAVAPSSSGAKGGQVTKASIIQALRTEMTEKNTELALKMNEGIFNRKFDIQLRQITEGLVVPETVLDPDMDVIWREVVGICFTSSPRVLLTGDGKGLKGNVKANLMPTLRNHFFEKAGMRTHQDSGGEGSKTQGFQDQWALRYLNLSYTQPILEAIDDDASGFITVEEINQFTGSRPKEWR